MRFEPSQKRVRVEFNGARIADSSRALVLHETRLPPAYYFPPDDVAMEHLVATPHRTFCEWKGQAHYYTVAVGDLEAPDAVWSYSAPTKYWGSSSGNRSAARAASSPELHKVQARSSSLASLCSTIFRMMPSRAITRPYCSVSSGSNPRTTAAGSSASPSRARP